MSMPNRRPDKEILRIVGQVRRRWRLKLLLRGLAIALGGALLTFLVSAIGLETLRFQPQAIETFRIILWVAIALFLIRAVRGRCSVGLRTSGSPSIWRRTNRRCNPAC